MKVALTGARGFAGRYVLKALESAGHEVLALSRQPMEGRWVRGSLEAPPPELFAGVDVLVHCAGEVVDPQFFLSTNFEGTKSLYEASCKAGVSKFIHLSSVGVYGPISNGVVTEESPLNPVGEYEKSKAKADEWLLGRDENVIILRPSIVFGQDMPNDSLRGLVRAVDRGRFFFIGAKGAVAPYIPVEDVADAVVNALSMKRGIYNLSDDLPLEDFVARISSGLGRKPVRLRAPKWPVSQLAKLTGGIGPLTCSRIDALTRRTTYRSSGLHDWRPRLGTLRGLDACISRWGGWQDVSLKSVKVSRIAHIPYFLVSQLKRQVEDLQEEGMDVVLVSGPGEELKALKKDGPKHETIYIPRAIEPKNDFVALWNLWRFFLREKPHIAHSTTPKAGLHCSIAGFLAGVPLRFHTFTGQVWANASGVSRLIGKLSDRLMIAFTNQMYADSRSQVEFLLENGVVSNREDIKVVGEGSLAGVDLDRFDPERLKKSRKKIRSQLGIASNAQVCMFLGRVTAEKGIVELIEAFQSLRPSIDAHLLLVGPLEVERIPLPESTLHAIKEMPSIHQIGYVAAPEDYMMASDLMVMPSYREGFGTVVIEAAALGIPTLGTKVLGLVESIVDGETGILVPPRDSKTLGIEMENLLLDGERRKQLGARAKVRARSVFASTTVSHLVMDEYRKHLLRKGLAQRSGEVEPDARGPTGI